MSRTFSILVCAILTGLVVTEARAAETVEGENWRFSDGWWRAELTGVGGMYSGKTSRGGDLMALGSFEYEFPMYARTTLGLRAYPLFYYHQDDPADEIFGAGGGLATRIYQNEETYDGWFGEAGGSLIWQSDYIDKNSSRVNFLLEAGVGYEFPDDDWHVALKFFHISNGSMGSRNTGSNGVGLSVGCRF